MGANLYQTVKSAFECKLQTFGAQTGIQATKYKKTLYHLHWKLLFGELKGIPLLSEWEAILTNIDNIYKWWATL